MKLPTRPWDKPKRPDRRTTAEALVAIRAECDDAKRLSLMPVFGGIHGADRVTPGWFLVLESLHEADDRQCGVTISPKRLDDLRRLGMVCPVGEGGDAVTVYDVDMRAVAHALGAA